MTDVPRATEWSLFYEEEGGARYFLGSASFSSEDSVSISRKLMDLFWDDRLDTSCCIPVVLKTDIDEYDDE